MSAAIENNPRSAASHRTESNSGDNRPRTADHGHSTVDFDRDIRPILSDNCFQCHGPDANQRQADLRLDTREGLLGPRDGAPVVVADQPHDSELIRRITAADPAERMPPEDSRRRLLPAQVDLIRRWIAAGARWQPHWSFDPPKRPEVPECPFTSWPRNPVDAFVLARLQDERLAPSPDADATTLIRRITLDLTGLPPTPEEIDEQLSNRDPHAWHRLVDRLLASPRHGERMAVPWLDLARYADTSGYQSDGPRDMWRWRDWVIAAFNAGRPFDEFTIEQIAGDLLPEATLEQQIATGFNRNHRGNAEGGIVPEEFQVEYVVDRVDTTATVWMGLTLGCARCHDHKFDPVSQRDYYGMFAWFNNIPEHGRALKEGNSPPYITAPTSDQQQRLDDLRNELAVAERTLAAFEADIEAGQAQWEQSVCDVASRGRETPDASPADRFAADVLDNWAPRDHLSAHFSMERIAVGAAASVREASAKPPATSIEFRDGIPQHAHGRVSDAVALDGRRYLDAGDVANFGYFDEFTWAAWIKPARTDTGTILSRMKDTARSEGYCLAFQDGRLHVNLVKRWLDDAIRVETQRRFDPDRWHHVAVTCDGSRVADGITIYVDGTPEPLSVNLDYINQSFSTDEPLRIGAGGGAAGRFHGLIDDVRIYSIDLPSEDIAILATVDSPSAIAAMAPEQRTARQGTKLRRCFVEAHAAEHIRAAHARVKALRAQLEAFEESLPTVMVMQELAERRDTFILERGRYDQPGERVLPAVPPALPPLPSGVPANRLALARWIASPSHPLTARVAVNRYWQLCFGAGLVRTPEDFGIQGERPTHPVLMDWLAVEFAEASGGTPAWDPKRLLRFLVTSATYRQSSRVTPELLQRDPDNRLLARAARFRLSAEAVRDQALAAGGLLVERIGGPSLRPYQPEGLWKEIASDTEYRQDHGAGLYRRSLYTFWKRTVSPPTLATFDASTREACIARRARTNTPLQALALLNDVTFVEAARMLAERVMAAAGSPADRLTLAFRRATARQPGDAELKILTDGFHDHLEGYRKNTDAAEQLLSIGEAPRNKTRDTAELAAYTTVCGLILNLDEVVSRE